MGLIPVISIIAQIRLGPSVLLDWLKRREVLALVGTGAASPH